MYHSAQRGEKKKEEEKWNWTFGMGPLMEIGLGCWLLWQFMGVGRHDWMAAFESWQARLCEEGGMDSERMGRRRDEVFEFGLGGRGFCVSVWVRWMSVW